MMIKMNNFGITSALNIKLIVLSDYRIDEIGIEELIEQQTLDFCYITLVPRRGLEPPRDYSH